MTRRPPTRRPPARPPVDDWAAKVEAARLERWADLLDGVPPGAHKAGRELPMRRIESDDRREIAEYLHRLAGDPRALKALLAATKPSARRGPKADRPRVWLALLEFHCRRRHAKSDLVAVEVAGIWRMSRSALFAAERVSGARTAANRTLGGWRYWAAFELRRFRATHRDLTPRARRAAFIEYLRTLQ